MYDHQLAYWRTVYPAESFCIVSFEMTQEKPVAALHTIADFLGLDDFKWKYSVNQVRNMSHADEVCLCY
jgi:hypothetical protein